MKIKYTNLKLLLLLLVFAGRSIAGPIDKYGVSAAPELLIPVGSASTALGGSNLAAATGLDAIFWNPSGLTTLNGKTGEVLFSNQSYIANIHVNYFAGAYNLSNFGTLAFSIKSLSFGDIEVTTILNPEGTNETYSPTFLTSGLTFARQMTDRIGFGTTFKVIYNGIARESATSWAFDFGINYNVTGSGLQFGVVLKNLGPSMTFTGQDLQQFYVPAGAPTGSPAEPRSTELASFNLPTSLSLGLSYDYKLDKKNDVMLHGTYQNNSFSSDNVNLGLEYNYSKMVYLRGGYQFAQSGTDIATEGFNGFSFGVGINYAASSNFNVGFDYAYRASDVFDANQFFTINLGF
ncbi:MAG TPA: PorV/PorQ family protein [Ignavibacteria bacterium]|nr:PorV/PorQ family protein [Ignavibacteria bacterium]